MSKTAFIFPGQGAQSVGMGRELCEQSAAARALFAEASQILGYDLAEVCFDGPPEKLDTTVISQPAIFVTSLAALEVLREKSPEVVASCSVAAGLSLGEYTALAFAGAIDFAAGVRLVQIRGEAMQRASDATSSGMVSILGMELSQIEKLCDEARGDDVLLVANHLCPGNIVVSGTSAACLRVADLANAAGAMKVIPLAVAGAFHTTLMKPADETLAAALAKTEIRTPRIPVISNVDAKPHTTPDAIRQTLVRQVVQPVLWETSVRTLIADGVDHFYEIGPGRVLRGLLKRIDRKMVCE
ncbi:MAG: ACP S-malonyltransferase [Thermoguttaceae bacterium]